MPDRLYDSAEITRRSYEYIDENLDCSDLDPLRRAVTRRVVHSTGDFSMENKLWFSEGVRSTLQEILDNTLPIVTDVSMVESGIRSSLLSSAGLTTYTYVHTTGARDRADAEDLTRSAAGLDLALEDHDRMALVVGNAPTVLFRLMDRSDVSPERVPLVIGSPVGFISVEESKRELRESEFTSIGVKGNRGGSPVAASIMNALLQVRMREYE